MTKAISLEIYFLVQGLFPLEAYSIDEFELQTLLTNEALINQILEEYPLYFPLQVVNASFQKEGDKDSYFLVLTNKHFSLELDNNLIDINKESIDQYIKEYLLRLQDRLEKELKLITNMNIALPIAIAHANKNEKHDRILLGSVSNYHSNLKVYDYDEKLKKILTHRLSRRISIKSIEELGEKNSRFQRAMDFYYSSFITSDRNISFTLLFSALEALFNLENEEITVTEAIADSTSKILFVDEKKKKKVKFKIKDYYDRRSYFIHGNEPKEITEKKEFDLREIVRQVLLIYWQISITEKITNPLEIADFITKNKEDDLDLVLQSFIIFLKDNDFKNLHSEILSLIKDNIM